MKEFTLTNRDIVNSINALNELGKIELPVKPGFAISKTKRHLRRHGEDIEEQRLEYLSKLCSTRKNAMNGKDEIVRDEEGEPQWLDPEQGPKTFADQYNALLEVEVEGVRFHQFPLSAVKRYRIPPNIIEAVPYLFTDFDDMIEEERKFQSQLESDEGADPNEESKPAKKGGARKKAATEKASTKGPKSSLSLDDDDWEDPTAPSKDDES